MINRAYTIRLLPPAAHYKAKLSFARPKARNAFIPRDITRSAEAQAKTLAEATPGFLAFGALAPTEWVYIISPLGYKSEDCNAC